MKTLPALRQLHLWMLLCLPVAARANPAVIEACLDSVDVACAERVLSGYNLETTRDPQVLYLAARARFFSGRYDEAYLLIAKAIENGYQDRWDELGTFERTRAVHRDFASKSRGDRYVVRYRPGLDAVLLEEALDAAALAEEHIAPLLGGRPPGPIVVEVYPSGKSFTESSSLTEKDVKTTGVVALSKWGRVLVTSPRALGRGYDWEDTIAHEYIHQVVSHHSQEKAPVWLQEGLAKYLDNRWRDGVDRFQLDPRSESLLARAIADGQLIPFEMMHPSLAKLPTAEQAALAYAQLASLIHFVVHKKGDPALLQILPKVKAGVDPRLAVANAAGYSDFQALESAWTAWVKTRGLKYQEVAAPFVSLDDVAGADADPVLSQRRDLARYLRLGELLAQGGHHEAALMEYAKANTEDGETSPLLQTRIAESHLALGDPTTARAQLQHTLAMYPDHAPAWLAMGRLELSVGHRPEALRAFQQVAHLDPFDAEVHELLVRLYRESGNPQKSGRHAEQLRILQRGGEG